ncbi:histidine phosphatase family protein [Paracoccaceae bacterium]|jgi:phosphohistidine phosphatase SixA|nr:histidine phosphatase family protein [Paracoccaceae bacterium]
MRFMILTLLFAVVLITDVEATSNLKAVDNLNEAVTTIDANVVFMRHALAPGFGDPDDFDLTLCRSQRNLSGAGQAQAKKIGVAIRKSIVNFKEVISSEWCRCKDTTALLNLGKWQTFEGLNSFFQDYADKTLTLGVLQKKLDSIESGFTLMVTHQVVINAITKNVVRSGELVAYNSKTKESFVFSLDDGHFN